MLQRDKVNFLASYATQFSLSLSFSLKPKGHQDACYSKKKTFVVPFYKIPRMKPRYVRHFIIHLISTYRT